MVVSMVLLMLASILVSMVLSMVESILVSMVVSILVQVVVLVLLLLVFHVVVVVVIVIVGFEGFGVGRRIDEGVEVHHSLIVFGFLLDADARGVVWGARLQPSGATMLNGECLTHRKIRIIHMTAVLVMVKRKGRIVIVETFEIVKVCGNVCEYHFVL